MVKWRFWKQQIIDKTILQVTESSLTNTKSVYVEAQSSEKALELMEKLKSSPKAAGN